MKFYRITISSWTASFRYPNVISGYQPTLLVPPVSTVLGLIDAAAGNYIDFDGRSLGYYFEYEGKGKDWETIYQFADNGHGAPKNQVKSNVIQREFLAGCRLYIYLPDKELAEYFHHPAFQLLLGQHADRICGQVVPLEGNYLPGTIHALPKYFTNSIPRQNLGTEAYSVIPYTSKNIPTHLNAYRDEIEGKSVDIYIHQINIG